MAPRIYTINTPSNPFLQVLYFVVGAIVLAGALVIGAVVLSFLVGLALIVGLVIYIRIWWLKRKMRRAGHSGASPTGPGGGGSEAEVIEVEYTVVRERDDRED